MNTNNLFYPFDPSGVAASNLVVGERQVINPPGILDFYYIVPKAGPYFRDSMKLTLYPSGRELIEGVDYTCSHLFHAATHATGQGVYGSLTFYDHTLTGTVGLGYQTIGGDWVIDEATILQLLANVRIDPRVTTWESAIDVPYQFPSIAHEFNIDDFTGAEDIVASLMSIRDAIIISGDGQLSTHLADFANPHRVTKAQVGLPAVENWSPATPAQAQAGTLNTAYMTPLRTAQAIQTLAWTRIDDHRNDFSNPHQTTKAQIGLALVENLQLAATNEAELGGSHARYMTPLRTKEAIEYQIGSRFDDFVARRDNPHAVSKSQVGLGNLENFPIASTDQAQEGMLNTVYMTAQRVREAIYYQAGLVLQDHMQDDNNPHAVTKAQVGLSEVRNLPTADQAVAEAAISNDHYMTPLMTRYAIQVLADASVGVHAGLINNPHQTTKAQVGLGFVENFAMASQADAEDGQSNSLYMTPLRTTQAITALTNTLLNSHTGRTDNPHGVTKAQIGLGSVMNYPIATKAQAEAGVSNVVYMTALRTREILTAFSGEIGGHIGDKLNPHDTTAEQVGAYSKSQMDAALELKLDANDSAIDSERVYGMTQGDMQTWIASLTAANAVLFNGQTIGQLTTDILAGTASNAMELAGSTKAELIAEIRTLVETDQPEIRAAQQTIIPHFDEVIQTGTDANPVYVKPPVSWFKFGSIPINMGQDRPRDVVLMLSGGKSATADVADDTPVVRATIVFNNMLTAEGDVVIRGRYVEQLNAGIPMYTLHTSTTTDGDGNPILDLWVEDVDLRGAISVTELSDNMVTFNYALGVRNQADVIGTSPPAAAVFTEKRHFAEEQDLSDALTHLTATFSQGATALLAL